MGWLFYLKIITSWFLYILLKFNRIPVDQQLTQEEMRHLYEVRKRTTEEKLERIEQFVSILEIINNNWLDYIQKTKNASRKKEEEEIYIEMADQEKGILRLLSQGREVKTTLKLYNKDLEIAICSHLKEVSAIGPRVTVHLPQLQLRTFSGDPETWRQGEALLAVRGYDIALKITISFESIETSIKSKLPIWILHKVYEQKKRGSWSITRLRQILGELVQINEEIARNQSFSNEKKSIDFKQKRASHNNKGETSALSTIKQFKSTKSSGHESTTQPKKIARDKRPCAFCNKDHWDNECSTYPTLIQ
ncbi:hypothetical protein DINM_003995 [Dirofilaria immitis]|nr:hypothetical protein [Dirofilaria immitis]